MWTKTLDPKSPDFGFDDDSVVASTDGIEDCDAIDPSLLLDPTTGRLWLTYGTYFGFIRLVELDPKTGKRVAGNQPVNIAIDMRSHRPASIGMAGITCWARTAPAATAPTPPTTSAWRAPRKCSVLTSTTWAWTCSKAAASSSWLPAAASSGRAIRPARSGRRRAEILMHYEADLDRSGRSVLDIRAAAVERRLARRRRKFRRAAHYEISPNARATHWNWPSISTQGFRRGGLGVRAGWSRRCSNDAARWRTRSRGDGKACPVGPRSPIAPRSRPSFHKLARWKYGGSPRRIYGSAASDLDDHAVTNAGGYPGSPYFKITIAGTDRALAATEKANWRSLPPSLGATEQLWRIDQLVDGTYRIMPKTVPIRRSRMALTAVGGQHADAGKFDPQSDKARWTFKTP